MLPSMTWRKALCAKNRQHEKPQDIPKLVKCNSAKLLVTKRIDATAAGKVTEGDCSSTDAKQCVPRMVNPEKAVNASKVSSAGIELGLNWQM